MSPFAHKHRVELPDGRIVYTDKDYLRGLMQNQQGGPGAPQLHGHAWGAPVPLMAGLGGGGTWGMGQAAAPMIAQQPPYSSPDTRLGTGAYATLTLLAATAGGGTVGYVASGSPEGAITGAAFTGGFSALSAALLFGRENNTGGALMMSALGLTALGASFLRFSKIAQRTGSRRR